MTHPPEPGVRNPSIKKKKKPGVFLIVEKVCCIAGSVNGSTGVGGSSSCSDCNVLAVVDHSKQNGR